MQLLGWLFNEKNMKKQFLFIIITLLSISASAQTKAANQPIAKTDSAQKPLTLQGNINLYNDIFTHLQKLQNIYAITDAPHTTVTNLNSVLQEIQKQITPQLQKAVPTNEIHKK